MSLKLTILGCHSATPRVKAHPTSQYLEINNRHFLIDCGEGTQRQIRIARENPQKITKIFISHWHGDHVFGLPGLLQTMILNGYNKKLEIYEKKLRAFSVIKFTEKEIQRALKQRIEKEKQKLLLDLYLKLQVFFLKQGIK